MNINTALGEAIRQDSGTGHSQQWWTCCLRGTALSSRQVYWILSGVKFSFLLLNARSTYHKLMLRCCNPSCIGLLHSWRIWWHLDWELGHSLELRSERGLRLHCSYAALFPMMITYILLFLSCSRRWRYVWILEMHYLDILCCYVALQKLIILLCIVLLNFWKTYESLYEVPK